MADNLKPEDRRRTMRAVKSKGTRLERRLAGVLAGMGYRGWRRNESSLPGTPDFVFSSKGVVIFIDGCFWHGCPYCKRKFPTTNPLYWKKKIQRNIQLAKSYNRYLRAKRWRVIRIWEHELKTLENMERVKKQLHRILGAPDNR